ncbi:MAG: type II secretion system protein GspD, partial [Planctomycetales bacterium]|nr:type II secretion system protein GspD [Planctomycetales bacterium]
LSPRGKVMPLASARSLLVVDFPDRVAMVRKLLTRLDGDSPGQPTAGPRQLKAGYFETHYIPVASAKEAVTALLSLEGKSAILPDEDRLLVVDYPEVLTNVEATLAALDQPRKMIRITSFIYDISIEDMETLGVNWSHALKGQPDAAGSTAQWAIDTITRVPFDAGATSGVMTFMNMSENFDLSATINALSNCSESRLLADPNVVVVENEEANVAIIQEIPFQQLTQTGQGGNIGTTAFREAGVKLTVKGRVARNDTVWMEVAPEFSRLAGFTPQDNQPIIDRRTAKSVVRIVNGRTLVIGGLRQRTDVSNHTGIPYLMDLPLGVGHLFRNRETTVRESELVVFIRPEIVAFDNPRNCREDAALQTNRHYLDSIRPGECGGCQPQYEEYYEEVLPLEEQVVPMESGPALGESAARQTSGSLSPFAMGDIVRIPATTSPSDAHVDNVSSAASSSGLGEVRRLPTMILPTRLAPLDAKPIALPPVEVSSAPSDDARSRKDKQEVNEETVPAKSEELDPGKQTDESGAGMPALSDRTNTEHCPRLVQRDAWIDKIFQR